MSLIDNLTKIYAINECKETSNWYEYIVETPKFRFNNFIHEFTTGVNLILVSIRDDFERPFAIEFLEYLVSCDKSFLICDSIRKDSIISFSKSKMNASLFLGPSHHTSYKTEANDVYLKTTVCFPIYNCEFEGDESSDETMLMRRDFVSTVNWNRAPSPKIRFRFDNPKTKAGTIGKKFGLIKLDVVENEIENLSGIEKAYMELINFKEFYVKICSKDRGCYAIYDKDKNTIFSGDLNPTLDMVKKFLVDGKLK